MKKEILVLTALALALGASGTALAQGKSVCSPGINAGAFIDHYGEFGGEPTGSPTPGGYVNTLGGALSGGFYGNTSNAGEAASVPANGHGVLPSLSPGPQINNGGGPGTGTSVGGLIQGLCPPS